MCRGILDRKFVYFDTTCIQNLIILRKLIIFRLPMRWSNERQQGEDRQLLQKFPYLFKLFCEHSELSSWLIL